MGAARWWQWLNPGSVSWLELVFAAGGGWRGLTSLFPACNWRKEAKRHAQIHPVPSRCPRGSRVPVLRRDPMGWGAQGPPAGASVPLHTSIRLLGVGVVSKGYQRVALGWRSGSRTHRGAPQVWGRTSGRRWLPQLQVEAIKVPSQGDVWPEGFLKLGFSNRNQIFIFFILHSSVVLKKMCICAFFYLLTKPES